MKNIVKTALGLTLLLTLSATTASASPDKGHKYYTKKLKDACGLSEEDMAGKHTQEEWLSINNAGNIVSEIKAICPNAEEDAFKEKYIPHYFDFFFEYGSDSGNLIYQ